MIAKNWEEYISQGPEHAAVKVFWENNYSKIPGSWASDYFSWRRWYNGHYRSDWLYDHKEPEEVLNIMKNETLPEADKPENILNDFIDLSSVRVRNKDVDIQNLTPKMKNFLNYLNKAARKNGYSKPVVNSGYRNPRGQARAMANNWKKHGGLSGGKEYLVGLYSDDVGLAIDQIFSSLGTGPEGIKEAAEYIANSGRVSAHLRGDAIDLQLTSDIREFISKIKAVAPFSIKVLDEGDHIHIQLA
jgi:hypothetical protein